MKKIFIVWGREVELSKHLLKDLDVPLKQIYIKKVGNLNLPIILRYVIQGGKTLFILFKNKPEVVVVQNPPIFAAVVTWIYCIVFKAKLAIDSHTAAFLDKKWVYFHWLFKFIAKRAVLNTCHNYKNLKILEKWGVKPAMVVQFYNPVYNINKLGQTMDDKRIGKAVKEALLPIMMVNRFANDDDWQTVLKTAKITPEATFFITGGISKNIKMIIKKAPDNVYFTGYLEHAEFMKLMWRCKVILAFTLRPDTILWSIREIMALRKPFVTTDSEVLRHYFREVALFTKSDPNELKEKILLASKSKLEIENKINDFLKKDRKRWAEEINKMKKCLEKK